MSLFLDCEFNGHNGHLISIAMVADDGDEFYEVVAGVQYKDTIPWVRINVLPKLEKEGVGMDVLEGKLQDFLRKHAGETVIADSPADFRYLMDCLHKVDEATGQYYYLNLAINMQFAPSGKYTPENPHNALSDARALKKWYNEEGPFLKRPRLSEYGQKA